MELEIMSDSNQGVGIGSDFLEGTDARESRKQVAEELERLMQRLNNLPEDTPPREHSKLLMDVAELEIELTQNESAWNHARHAFDLALNQEEWQQAVEACDLLYRSEQAASVVALGNGIWLAVTYPVDPQASYTLMSHFVDETPENSDGAAVAAMLAHYLAEIRADDKDLENVTFLTRNLIGSVAQRHSKVKSQQELDIWIKRLQLDDAGLLLKRMAQILDVVVDGQWWYDRDALRERLPE
jgi:hypothetical protein